MSREIKFKAWDESRQRIVPPHNIIGMEGETSKNFPSDLILMQFTGLKDKNGVFYLCSLATAFLNKIHGCGTVIDRKVIKCLAVNTDLFYMGESEQLLEFHDFTCDILASDSMTALQV